MDFKSEFTFEERKKESQRIKSRFGDRVPIVCQRSNTSRDIPIIDKKKYLVPFELTLGQFLYVIRKRIKLSPSKALFIFINDKILPVSSQMYNIYDEHKDEDGFLYITYATEETFG